MHYSHYLQVEVNCTMLKLDTYFLKDTYALSFLVWNLCMCDSTIVPCFPKLRWTFRASLPVWNSLFTCHCSTARGLLVLLLWLSAIKTYLTSSSESNYTASFKEELSNNKGHVLCNLFFFNPACFGFLVRKQIFHLGV